jgi:hypothetical protein
MEPSEELIDRMYRERVLWARAEPPEQKLLDGPRLFDASCIRMAAGIRGQLGITDQTRILEVIRHRLARIQQVEESL